jgi:hypothetical protein
MEETDNKKSAFYEIGPADKPYARVMVPEKRSGLEDRRKIPTFIADDRRSGIANRRKRKKRKESAYISEVLCSGKKNPISQIENWGFILEGSPTHL